MKKKRLSAAKCMAMAVSVFALAIQPCFTFPAYALTKNYNKDMIYPIWDDPDYNYSSYWQEDMERKVTNVTRTYSDGTTYTAAYQYNAQGNLTEAKINEADGSKVTITRSYSGERLVSNTLYEYDAISNSEETYWTEYGEDGLSYHDVNTVKYSDKSTSVSETWYLSTNRPSKKISHERDGSETSSEWQYDEEGNVIYYKSYDSDPSMLVTETVESWLEGDAETEIIHTIETYSHAETGDTRVESWAMMPYETISKRITTAPDGSQTIEEYSYDEDRQETLYTRTEGGQISERRETVKTSDTETTTTTASDGSRKVIRRTVDIITETTTTELTYNMADGSSSYQKYIYDNYGYNYGHNSLLSEIRRETAADGTESYYEFITNADGSTTVKEKHQNGTVTSSKSNALGKMEFKKITQPDGTWSETVWEYIDDGSVAAEITRYSDGSEDRLTCEYNENGDVIKVTESHRNGLSAVTLKQYQDNSETGSITFNNGYKMSWTMTYVNSRSIAYSCAYSHGEVSEDTVVITDTGLEAKTVYRDGRVDSFTMDNDSEDNADYNTKLYDMYDRYSTFEEIAWSILPGAEEAATQASASNAV